MQTTEIDWSVYVVNPFHLRAKDRAYHDVSDALSAKHWQTALQLATESQHSLKEVRRVLGMLEREGGLIEEARSDEGKCYRFEGCSRRDEEG